MVAVWLCAAAAPGSAIAGGGSFVLKRAEYGQRSPGWHTVSADQYAYFGDDGWYSGRWMYESEFEKMSLRLAGGAEGGGAGRSTSLQALLDTVPGQASKSDSIWNGLRSAVGKGAFANALYQARGEGLSLMERVKSFGVLRAIGDVALAATAFETGYWVGGKVADLLWPGRESTGLVGGEGGYLLKYPYKAHVRGEGEAIGYGSGVREIRSTMPVAGAVIEMENGSGGKGTAWDFHREQEGGTNEKGEPRCKPNYVIENSVPGMYQVVTSEVEEPGCATKGTLVKRSVLVAPLEVTKLPGDGTEKPMTVKGTAVTPVGGTEAKQDAEECFEEKNGCKALPRWWWNNDPEAKEATHVEEPRGGLDPADPTGVQIPDPAVGEKYSAYDSRLEKLGLKPEPHVLAETSIDPAVGPEGVSSTSPHIGSSVAPESSVKVRYNPVSAPETSAEQGLTEESGGPSGWSAPSIPSISLTPLSAIGVGCNKFPFGVFCWFGEAITSWGAEGECPSFNLPIGQGTGVDSTGELGVNTCVIEPAMEIVRPVLVALCTLSIGLWFGFAGLGLGAGGGGAE